MGIPPVEPPIPILYLRLRTLWPGRFACRRRHVEKGFARDLMPPAPLLRSGAGGISRFVSDMVCALRAVVNSWFSYDQGSTPDHWCRCPAASGSRNLAFVWDASAVAHALVAQLVAEKASEWGGADVVSQHRLFRRLRFQPLPPVLKGSS